MPGVVGQIGTIDPDGVRGLGLVTAVAVGDVEVAQGPLFLVVHGPPCGLDVERCVAVAVTQDVPAMAFLNEVVLSGNVGMTPVAGERRFVGKVDAVFGKVQALISVVAVTFLAGIPVGFLAKDPRIRVVVGLGAGRSGPGCQNQAGQEDTGKQASGGDRLHRDDFLSNRSSILLEMNGVID